MSVECRVACGRHQTATDESGDGLRGPTQDPDCVTARKDGGRLTAYLPLVSSSATSAGPWLIAGLGNPGSTYAGNRHNVGAMVIDELARRTGTSLKAHMARAAAGQARLGLLPGGVPGPAVILAVPSSYMNESGGPVKALMSFFSIPAERLIVIHDELDIDAGVVRLKSGGGEGGHNGLRSISASLGTKDYVRVRVGIGRPPGRMDPADYVLRDFGPAERKELPFLLDVAADAAEAVVIEGLLGAQQRFHSPV